MPESIEELPIVGGHPALDLVNTVAPRAPELAHEGPHDYLLDPRTMLTWARRAGIVDDNEERAIADAWERDPATAKAALDAVKEIREALHTALLTAARMSPQGDERTQGALERLHERWATAVTRSKLTIASPIALEIGRTPATVLTDRAAHLSVEILRTADYARLRRCPPDQGGCGWIVLDHTRNGSRRWCRMADCGTTVKARRLTERRRASRSTP